MRDTNNHTIENANVKVWKSDEPTILQTLETDANGEYLLDISTGIVGIPAHRQTPLRVLNNGNSNHIGLQGTLAEEPEYITITDITGRAITNIPFNYDLGSNMLTADWQAEKPGIYFANIIGQHDNNVLKFLATSNGAAPSFGTVQQSMRKSTADERIKYYTEISADGNEPIRFDTVLDSVEVAKGEIAYPEHFVTPNIDTYTAPVQGQITLAGNPVGANFRVVLSPETGDAQELFTDENGNFSTTVTIPHQAFPYNPATINLDVTAEPTQNSIQTTTGNASSFITDSEEPFTLDMAVDSAWISLSGYLGTGVSGTVAVDGKTVLSGDLATTYDLDKINTVKDNLQVVYQFQKYHHEDVNETRNVAVWSDTEFNPSFTFIPAAYTATITSDEGANIAITKQEGGEQLWNYTSTGTNQLPTLQRNELDSILVELTAELTGKIDYDTTFYIRENLPNNIRFNMKDEEQQTATYTATITSDEGANIAITKQEGGEQLWNYISTGTDNLPTITRTELDSILVELTAELTGKIDYDTTFYIRENLPNNIRFNMKDEDPQATYQWVWGIVTKPNGTSIEGVDVIYTRATNPIEQYNSTTAYDGSSIYYDFGNTIPVYNDPETYNVSLEVADGRGLMPTTHTTTIPASGQWAQRDFVIQELPNQKIQGTIRDADALASIDGTMQDEAVARLDGVIVQFMQDVNNDNPYNFTDDIELDRDTTDADGYYQSHIRFTPGTDIYMKIGGKEGYHARGGSNTYKDWRYNVIDPQFAIDTLKTVNWTLPRKVGKYGAGANDTITVSAFDIAMMVGEQNIEHAMGRGALFNYEQFIEDDVDISSEDVNRYINDFTTAFPNANIIRTTNTYHLNTADILSYDYQTNYYPDSVITHVKNGIDVTDHKYIQINQEYQILFANVSLSGWQKGFNKETGRALGFDEVSYPSFMYDSGGAITNRDKRNVILILNQGQFQYQHDYDSFSYKNLREDE